MIGSDRYIYGLVLEKLLLNLDLGLVDLNLQPVLAYVICVCANTVRTTRRQPLWHSLRLTPCRTDRCTKPGLLVPCLTDGPTAAGGNARIANV